MDQSPDPVQQTVFDFLANPATHGGRPVKRIDTHCASVFLAGDDVYKVKRAVHYPYLDFSTLDRRHAACCAEMEVNRENAPTLYLGVVPIVRRAGGLAIGGEGAVVEWAVHLRRFDEEATLDRLAAQGPLGPAMMAELAEAILAAHRRAPIADAATAVQRFASVVAETAETLRGAPALLAPQLADSLALALREAEGKVAPLLAQRAAAGWVRRCHGDLHLGNIARIDGRPVLFDAVEFDDAIATCDVLYDLAFVLMDLCERGRPADANMLFNRYLAGLPAEAMEAALSGLAALPLFMALRAAIRAKVEMARGRGPAATRYAETACDLLAPRRARLVAVGGLSGSGKTVLAAALAPLLGRAPGAVHLRSDIERKHLLGRGEYERLGADAYRPEVSAAVQARLLALAETALRASQSVILDATHRLAHERAAVETLARRLDLPFVGLWLDAGRDVLMQRVAARQGDASDATAAVVAAQLAESTDPVWWTHLDATVDREALRQRAERLVLSEASA